MGALGKHLVLDLYECNPKVLCDLELLKGIMVEAAKRSYATIVDVFSQQEEGMIRYTRVLVIIAESHLSIFTWPEYGCAVVDIFTCGETMRTDIAAEYIRERLESQRNTAVEFPRGLFLKSPEPKSFSEIPVLVNLAQ